MSARDLKLVYALYPNDKTGSGLIYYEEGYDRNSYDDDMMRSAAVRSGYRYIMRRRGGPYVLFVRDEIIEFSTEEAALMAARITS